MLHYQPRAAEFSDARLGLVVGKKLLKRSVDRNRLKRILREQFRCMRPDLPSCDFVVRLAVKPGKLDRKLVVSDFVSLLNKLQRLKAKRNGS